jgi:GWxTD domain-containing protein
MTSLMLFFRQPLLHALGWSLLHFCWQGTVVAILLAIILELLLGCSPQLRYAISCGALLLMMVFFLGTFARLSTTPQVGEIRITIANSERNPSSTFGNGLGTTETWFDRMARKLDPFVPWVLSVWFAGVVFLLGRLNLGLIAARRMKTIAATPAPAELQLMLCQLSHRLGIERTIKFVNSALVQVPTVIGWLRPVILIPIGCLAGISTGQVEAVLAHELAHIRRHDYLVSIFQSVVETLLFYHPAVWWVSQQVRREREHCCDDLAVRISGDSLAYAKALSFLEERRASLPLVALGANGGVLTMRIRRLLGCKELPMISQPAAVTVLAVVFVITGLCIATAAKAASQQVASQQTTPENAQDLPVKYQQWLNEDVVWIIAPEERTAFSALTNDEERDQFVEQFWQRRNPVPGSSENKFKAEHYRRIAYANTHFAASIPGWKTDRGRIYIVYGPPDEIDSHPIGSPDGLTKPTEFWRYHLIRERGVDRKNVDLTFVDTSGHGDYQLLLPVNPANN